MERYDLLENIAFSRYTIEDNLPDGTVVEVCWPDGTYVVATVVGHDEHNHSITMPS